MRGRSRGALDAAAEQMDSSGIDVAFLAMFHRWNSTRNVAYETTFDGRMYRLCHRITRGTLYANFAMGRRGETFERLGYFDERYFFYGARSGPVAQSVGRRDADRAARRCNRFGADRSR